MGEKRAGEEALAQALDSNGSPNLGRPRKASSDGQEGPKALTLNTPYALKRVLRDLSFPDVEMTSSDNNWGSRPTLLPQEPGDFEFTPILFLPSESTD